MLQKPCPVVAHITGSRLPFSFVYVHFESADGVMCFSTFLITHRAKSVYVCVCASGHYIAPTAFPSSIIYLYKSSSDSFFGLSYGF